VWGRGGTNLKNAPVDAGRDSLAWNWKVDAGTEKADFAAPLTSTSYAVCVFDQGGLVVGGRVPAGGSCGTSPCWSDGASGFKYRNRSLTPDGISKVELKASTSGRGKIKVRGKGPNLELPGLDLATPVTVRLVGSDVTDCWEAVYSTPSRNDAERFKAKSD
jgi:hypothetical protein